MWHVNQLLPSCDFCRCVLSWSSHVKRSEHWPHEYGFAPVWIRTWYFILAHVLNILPQYGQRYGILFLCTKRLCLCNACDWRKLLWQSEHLNLTPVWIVLCSYRLPRRRNTLPHTSHLYGFSSLWILLCESRFIARLNRLLQTLHSNGFSSEWISLCAARSLLVRQHLPHSVHWYLPVWIFLWRVSVLRDEKHIPHSPHENIFSTVCISVCLYKQYSFANRLSQTVHTNRFSPLWLRSCLFKCDFCVNRLSHIVHKCGLGFSMMSAALISDSWDLSLLLASASTLPANTQQTNATKYTN